MKSCKLFLIASALLALASAPAFAQLGVNAGAAAQGAVNTANTGVNSTLKLHHSRFGRWSE